MRNFLLFSVDARRYAVPLESVRRVVRMVDITPLPESPPPIAGVVNWGGEIVPVFDTRRVMGGASRPVSPSDLLLLAEAQGHSVALAVDSVEGLLPLANEAVVRADEIVPGTGIAEEMTTLSGEIVLLWNLSRFLAGYDAVRESAGEHAP